MARPLDGVRVLDFTHVLAGPFATRILADLGADVVKVVSEARPGNTPVTSYFQMWNRNKRSLALDMSTNRGREIARSLAERADVVIENFSPGVLDRWGMGYAAVAAVNPGVIYVQMSGMGDSGPWRDFVSFAPTVHALSGLTYLTGMPGREDIGIGSSFNDHQAGLHGATVVLAALESRRRSGRGQRVDFAQYELGVALTGPALLDYFANGQSQQPAGNQHRFELAAPHDTYPCAGDDRWVAIAVMTEDHWSRFRTALGDPEWAQDSRFATAADRLEHADELDRQISEWTRALDAYELQARLQAAGVPAGVVQTGADLVHRDPQLAASGYFTTTEDSGAYAAPTPVDRLPLHFSKTPVEQYRAPRAVGADNVVVLDEWLAMPEEDVHAEEAGGTLR
ncbi:MAG: CoA transferase [Chloroflexi bacterium]|nr:CoA transferase [Chloroflexota bacterium]MDA1148246.1 CoA transferase [Chloroflexota bacterium]